ncbi:caspase family protein [Ruegeria atlantica]|uniref:caspase family protein n=1 Tax=Ruegeria atlantica TaxID=81569 RepID=UPI00147EF150
MLDLAQKYADDWVIISQIEPEQYASVMMYDGNLRFDLEEMQTYLGKGGIRISRFEPVNISDAVARMQTDGVSQSFLINGRQLASSTLKPLLIEPFLLFQVGEQAGTYPIALLDGDTDIAGRRRAWGKVMGEGVLLETFHFDINSPDEPILISFGDSISLSQGLDVLYLDGSFDRQQASNLLSENGFTYEAVKPFEPSREVLGSGFNGILTIPAKIRAPEFRDWLTQYGRNATIRRFGTVSTITEFSAALRAVDAVSLDAVPLDLTPVQAPTAPATSDAALPSQKQALPVALDKVQPNICQRFQVVPDSPGNRVALVVGNGSYHPSVGWLENPPIDAGALASMFLTIGFDVFLAREATAHTIRRCLEDLQAEYKGADVAVLHFSGHGVQVDDQNYLVPIDAEPGRRFEAGLVPFADLIQPLRRLSRTTLVFLDACRDNPFVDDEQGGLSALGSTPLNDDIDASQNSFAVVYATAADMVAEDGVVGERSPFTNALLSELPKQGISIQESLASITSAVGRATEWRQVPFQRSSLQNVLFLNGTQTYDEIVDTSRLRAAEAAAALDEGDIASARRLAALALPTDASAQQLSTDFREAMKIIEVLAFTSVSDFNYERTGETAVLVGENRKAALVGPIEGPLEEIDVFDASSGERVAAVPFISDYGAFDPAQIADSATDLVAIPDQTGLITLLDMRTKERSQIELVPPDINDRHGSYRIEHLEFSRDGSRLMVQTSSAGLFVYEVQSKAKILSLESLTIGDQDIQLSLAGNRVIFGFVDETTICFAANRVQSVSYPDPGRWDFLAVGTFDLERQKIDQLAWSTERWALRSLRCSPTGQHALIAVQAVAADEDYASTSAELHGLLDIQTGTFLAAEDLSSGTSYLSPAGDRAAFVDTQTLRLFDIKKSQFLNLPRLHNMMMFAHGENYLSFNGTIDQTSGMQSKAATPNLFALDLSAEAVIDHVFQQIPKGELASLEQERLTIGSR